MSVEILTVSLSDESIERLAESIIRLMSDKSGSTSANTRRTQSAEVSREEADPWANQGPTDGRAARPATRQSTGSPARADDGTKTVKTKNGVQVWSFPANAPLCECNEPSGFCKWTSLKGDPAKAYKCAKGSGDDWRNKCEFFQYVR